MEGKKTDINFKIFDYSYVSGSGKYTTVYTQTIFFVKTDRLNLPTFSMTPESIFNKIGDKLTKNDIDFEIYPIFSKKYNLNGKDKLKIRSVFSEKILQFLEQEKETISLEANSDKIIIYRRGEMIKPEILAEFKEKSLNLAQMFMMK